METIGLPETITVGFVLVLIIGLIGRFLNNMGQRTDPKLLELFELQTKANANRDEAQNKTYERLANALDRNTDTLDTVKDGIENSFNSFTESMKHIVGTITTEHAEQFQAIQAIPGEIMPSIQILKQQLEDHKGSVEQMTDTVDNQNGTIQQILEAVLRLESKVEVIAGKFNDFQENSRILGTEIKETQQEIVTIKGDIAKLKPIKEKKDDGQPIEHSRRLDNPTSTDSDDGGSAGGDDSKTVSA
jgi:methyl-accepting chemotaxis protein